MEPLDPARNDEGSGFSRRRISSILKAPRKSIRFPDPQQQENVVECAKPVEKRNSRRVSFAPANDVLLFSKDVKNASPAQSPLQDLIITTGTQNGVQITEDGIQQIMGMETLLNAPLHAAQQREKVQFDTGDDLGEKTVIFTTDNDFMDTTHCHTININGELLADISLQNYDPLPTREKTATLPANDESLSCTVNPVPVSRNTGYNIEKRNTSSSAPPLDPGFKNFLASLSKRSNPIANPVITRKTSNAEEETSSSLVQIKTQQSYVDKENQAPTSASAVMEKSLNAPRGVGELSFSKALCTEDDLSTDMTEAHTGRIQGFTGDDDDDPLQCLFPTQDMYTRVSQTTEKTKQQISKPLTSFNHKDMTSMKNPSLQDFNQRHKGNADSKEKTTVFTAGAGFMDMTQDHPVNIESSSLPPPNQYKDISHTHGKMENTSSQESRGTPISSANSLDSAFTNFISSLSKAGAPAGNPAISKPAASSSKEAVDTNRKEVRSVNATRSFGGSLCRDSNVSMDNPATQTGRLSVSRSDDAFPFLFPTQDMYSRGESVKKQEVNSGKTSSRSSYHTGIESSLKPSLKSTVQRNLHKHYPEDDCRNETVRFSADDAGMDVTCSHTANIATDFERRALKSSAFLPTCGEKTVRFTANDGAMDMTQCVNVNIACDLASDSPAKKHNGETSILYRSAYNLDPKFNTSLSKPPGTVCPDVSIDMAEAQKGHITAPDDPPPCLFPTSDNYPHSLKKAESTSRQQHIETPGPSGRKGMDSSLAASLKKKVQRPQFKIDAEDDCRERTVRFNDTCMDLMRSHNVNNATDLQQKAQQNVDSLPAYGEKTVKFTIDDGCLDITRSHTVKITEDFQQQSHKNVDVIPACGERTVKFTIDDGCLDITRSHTVKITEDFQHQSHKNVDVIPACGERTVKFTIDDGGLDITRSHTVKITEDFQQQSHKNVDVIPACGERTVRFTADDAFMDVTKSHTVNLAEGLQQPLDIFGPSATEITTLPEIRNVPKQGNQASSQRMESSPGAIDHDVDAAPSRTSRRMSLADLQSKVRRLSHLVNTAPDAVAIDACTAPLPQRQPDMNQTKSLPAPEPELEMDNKEKNTSLPGHFNTPFSEEFLTCGERTKFTADDACRDVTKSYPVKLAVDSQHILPDCGDKNSHSPVSDSRRYSNILSTSEMSRNLPRNRSLSALPLGPGFKSSLSGMGGPWAKQETVDTDVFLDQVTTQCVDPVKEAPCFVSAVAKELINKTTTGLPEDDVFMELTEAQRDTVLGYIEEPRRCLSPTQDYTPNPDLWKKTKDSSDPSTTEITTLNDPKPGKKALSQRMESSPGAIDHDVDAAPSRKSRRMSLADLQSKVRRLSHLVSTAPDAVAMDASTTPFPQPEHDTDQTKSLPAPEPELEMGNMEENTQAHSDIQEQPCTTTSPSTTTTPFKLNTKQLMSRLSVGSFKAKLPQRRKSDDAKKTEEHVMTVDNTNQLSNFDDIYNEELESYEDVSETLELSPPNGTGKVTASVETNTHELLEDNVFDQDSVSPLQWKRKMPEDDSQVEGEKRMKTTEEAADIETSHVAQCDGDVTAAPGATTQTCDYSNISHTASMRCEATFESTYKHSFYESHLEDYTNDMQRKLDDGTITVLEFFKLFNIDFVIHNPRQSILPARLLSDSERTPMDVLKDRHITRPKQLVYEADVLNLTEKVEGLKVRMQDLDKPLRLVNTPLWEEVRNSSEKELKSFGAKLKERNNLFRKSSKVQSHEMKEVLYSNLVQANLEEQQKSRQIVEEADAMLKILDDCICDIETELAAVEEKGFGDKPSLKSRQEEMQKVAQALADNDQQISKLETQKEQNLNKLKRLKAETRHLEGHVTALHMVNEWKLSEKRDDSTVYTFLHETLQLQLVYENGNDADNQSEKKISHITFKHQLDDVKSQDHACLVHKLIFLYVDGEGDWVEKYPTSRHVPNLLHDVSLVVSRCRLLGEELRLLDAWGGLRLDILHMRCVDTRVHIVFSSLKTMSKFELVLDVGLVERQYVLQIQTFTNMIGNTTIQQVEEIVASFSPGKKLLTKTIKKIHEDLLR